MPRASILMRGAGTRSKLRARSSLHATGFPNPVLFDHLPIWVVILLTSPTFHAPRSADRAGWNSVVLFAHEDGADYVCHLVGQRDSHQYARLSGQHTRAPSSWPPAVTISPMEDRHRPYDQQASGVARPHLRAPTQLLLAAARILSWHKARPGREVAPPAQLTVGSIAKSVVRRRLYGAIRVRQV